MDRIRLSSESYGDALSIHRQLTYVTGNHTFKFGCDHSAIGVKARFELNFPDSSTSVECQGPFPEFLDGAVPFPLQRAVPPASARPRISRYSLTASGFPLPSSRASEPYSSIIIAR